MHFAHKKIVGATLLGLCLPFSAQAVATLEDGYVMAGVSDYGTLGSNKQTSPGILFDPTGTANYGTNDLLLPGTPYEGFFITSSGGNYQSTNIKVTGPLTSFATFGLTQNATNSVTATSTSLDGLLGISSLYTLTTVSGRAAIEITTTLVNHSTAALNDLAFLRALDPDPDYSSNGSYDSVNVVLSADQACAEGAISTQAICIFSTSTFSHQSGVSTSLWEVSPASYLGGINGGNGDNLIGVGFNLGTLGAGGSLTFTYGYALGETLAIASTLPTGGGTVPEPATALLVASGLLGIAGSRWRLRS